METLVVKLRTERIHYSDHRATAPAAQSYHTKYERQFHKRVSNRTERALLDQILEIAGPMESVLDVPSGTGRVSDVIASHAKRVFEFDNSLEMVKLLRSTRTTNKQRVGVASVFHLPFRSRSLGLVVSIRLSHHIPDMEGRLWHIRELLRVSDRQVLMTFFDAGSFKHRMRELRRGLGGGKRSKYTLSRADVTAVARKHGYEPVGFWRLSVLFSGHTFALLRRQETSAP